MDAHVFHTDSVHSEIYSNSPYYRGSRLWNDLPLDIRSIKEQQTFGQRLHRYFYTFPPPPPPLSEILYPPRGRLAILIGTALYDVDLLYDCSLHYQHWPILLTYLFNLGSSSILKWGNVEGTENIPKWRKLSEENIE